MSKRDKTMFAKLLSVAAVVLICGPSLPVAAQDLECHENKDYLVAAKSYEGDAGQQFAIMSLRGKSTPKKCVFNAAKADFVIGKPGDPLWFGDQSGNLLILTRSTGPEGDLVIYDLGTRKTVLDVPSNEYAVEGGQIVFWQRIAAATRKNCPAFEQNEKDGLGSVIVAQKILDIRSASVRDAGKTRCDATQ